MKLLQLQCQREARDMTFSIEINVTVKKPGLNITGPGTEAQL